jgi:hypothetical protein
MIIQIHLEDSSVPVEVVALDDGPSLNAWVVQDSLGPYIAMPQGDGSLLRIRASIGKGQTVLGVSWHHVLGMYDPVFIIIIYLEVILLGDATTLLRFMRSLSQIYQNQPLLDPVPKFSKHSFDVPKPTAEEIAQQTPTMSHLACTYPPSEIGKKYAERNEGMVPIRVRWSVGVVEKLLGWVRGLEGSKVSLTRQDCITACVAVVLNLCRKDSVKKITNAAVVRRCDCLFDLICDS